MDNDILENTKYAQLTYLYKEIYNDNIATQSIKNWMQYLRKNFV